MTFNGYSVRSPRGVQLQLDAGFASVAVEQVGYAGCSAKPRQPLDVARFLSPLRGLGDGGGTSTGDKQLNCLEHGSLAAVVATHDEIDAGEGVERIGLESSESRHLE